MIDYDIYMPLGTFKKRGNFILNISIYKVLKITLFATITWIYNKSILEVNLQICKGCLVFQNSFKKYLCQYLKSTALFYAISLNVYQLNYQV